MFLGKEKAVSVLSVLFKGSPAVQGTPGIKERDCLFPDQCFCTENDAEIAHVPVRVHHQKIKNQHVFYFLSGICDAMRFENLNVMFRITEMLRLWKIEEKIRGRDHLLIRSDHHFAFAHKSVVN